MIVVADSEPLHYLVLLEHIYLLRRTRYRAEVDGEPADLGRCASSRS